MLPSRLSPKKTGVVACVSKTRGLTLQEDKYADAQISFRDEIQTWLSRGENVTIVRYGKEKPNVSQGIRAEGQNDGRAEEAPGALDC
jgi:hypothetical protein